MLITLLWVKKEGKMRSTRMELEFNIADTDWVEEERLHHLSHDWMVNFPGDNEGKLEPRSSRGRGRDGSDCNSEGTQDLQSN